jgi:outer membrane protein assembly factor BamB
VIGPSQTGAFLIAIDPSTQQEKWRGQGGGGIGGGTLTTAGNLVFQTLNNGRLLAFRADTGEKLLDIATNQTGGMGPPMTYAVGGKQYVAVAGGRGAAPAFNPGGGGGRGGRGGPAPAAPPAPTTPPTPATPPVLPRLYVYTLDGNAVNPTPEPPAPPAVPAGRGQQ